MKFNPYKQAAADHAMCATLNRRRWTAFCCKCNLEKPKTEGCKQEQRKGTGRGSPGFMRKFTCAECAANQVTA